MGKNKIRLRKKIISPDNIDQHKNYSGLMRRHDRYLRMRGLLRFLIYFTIATILMVLILFAMWKVKDDQHRKLQRQNKSDAAQVDRLKFNV
jgi:hypothetical protein